MQQRPHAVEHGVARSVREGRGFVARTRHDHRFILGGDAVELGPAPRCRVIGVEQRDWWESRESGPGVRVTAVPVQHFSNRGVADRNRTLWTGYVISGPSGNVFFAGDTAFGPHFQAIADAFAPIRLAILPIGAYKPEWFMGPVHQSPSQAIDAQAVLHAETALAIHFGTFPLADDGQDAPVDVLHAELKNRPDQRFWVLGFGEGRDVPTIGTPVVNGE